MMMRKGRRMCRIVILRVGFLPGGSEIPFFVYNILRGDFNVLEDLSSAVVAVGSSSFFRRPRCRRSELGIKR